MVSANNTVATKENLKEPYEKCLKEYEKLSESSKANLHNKDILLNAVDKINGLEVENVINRDFHADQPNTKWLTDITEFAIPAGKVYLSPIIDNSRPTILIKQTIVLLS